MKYIIIYIILILSHKIYGDTPEQDYKVYFGKDYPTGNLISFTLWDHSLPQLAKLCSEAYADVCVGFTSAGTLKKYVDIDNLVDVQDADLYMKVPLISGSPAKNRGSIWPLPAQWSSGNKKSIVNKKTFKIINDMKNSPSEILDDAIQRYEKLLFPVPQPPKKNMENDIDIGNDDDDEIYKKYKNIEMSYLRIIVLTDDERLYLGYNESYSLDVNEDSAKLVAGTVHGAMRGLESFSQLINLDWNGNYWIDELPIKIKDEPRYSHRGLLLDTARHFIPMRLIKTVIDGMAYSKLNVLHWHIVDDQAFPFNSTTFPLLSIKGTVNPELATYSHADVKEVIKYARYRSVRVVPEFDMPGHVRSWIAGYPHLQGRGNCNLDPTLESTYTFIAAFWQEIRELFEDAYLHIGGDEVNFDCWKTPPIEKWMKDNGVKNFQALETYFAQRLIKITTKLKSKVICWQEMYQNIGTNLPKGTVVEIWKNHHASDQPVLKSSTRNGYPTIVSGFWYLDHLMDFWTKFYTRDMIQADLTPKEAALVVGGEACMWAEHVDEYNLVHRIFPRATAMGEVLWSPPDFPKVPTLAAPRLHSWTCRVNMRGIDAEPVGVNLNTRTDVPSDFTFCNPV